ncbi:MAG: hypothetical protein NTW82_10485 [Bacteroidia bacterium]|nr:hypothetical protein [Bacteroidia bacterium]
MNCAVIFSQEEKSSPFNAGADIYSSYVWRGTRYGIGPAFQPNLKFTAGFFTAGAWGSFDFNGYQETDLYLSFSLPAGISLGATDYYYPDFDYFDYSTVSGSHAFEINLGFSKGGLALSANYILNEAGHAGSEGGDKYFEVKYSFDAFNLFAGAGDGWHTVDGNFAVCNIGLGTSRTIKITDSFSIPVTGQVVFNPDIERLYIVVGFTL